MKNLFYSIVALMLLFCASCTSGTSGVDEPVVNTPIGVVFDEGTSMNLKFEAKGGTHTFNFTSDLDWTLTSSDETWIKPSRKSGAPGKHNFTLSVETNTTLDTRRGDVVLATSDGNEHIIFVEQSGEEETFKITGSGEYRINPNGGNVEVKVTTNLEYDVEIPSDANSWLSVADTRTVRNETLTFTIAKNETFDERRAEVKLVGDNGSVLQKIVFVQNAVAEEFTLVGSNKIDVDYTGAEVKVELKTNLDYDIIIPAAAEWITTAESRVTSRTDEIVFVVSENKGFSPRTAKVTIKASTGKTINLEFEQSALDVYMELDKTDHIFTKDGGSVYVNVSTNIDYHFTVFAEGTWLKCTKVSDNKMEITADPMTDVSYRSGYILFLDEYEGERAKFIVEQDASYSIKYATNDSKVVDLNVTDGFGATFISNTYDSDRGVGTIRFDAPITVIPDQAFGLCTNLTTIDIPEGVTTIGASAFSGCSNMKQVTVPSTVEYVGVEAFYNCSGKAIINCEITGETYSSRGVAFDESGFSEVVIGDNVKTVGRNAFFACLNLKTVSFGKSVETIGNIAFKECYDLQFVVLPEGLKTIESYAFVYCTSLTSVTLPESLISIGEAAFGGCTHIYSVYCKPTDVPSSMGGIFYYHEGLTIYVPEGTKRSYMLAADWSAYSDCYVEFDFDKDVIVDTDHTSHPRDKWIGTWAFTSSQTMVINNDGVVIEDTPYNGNITIVPHYSYEDEVLIYGFSAGGYVARAIVDEDGTLYIVSGMAVGDTDSSGYTPTWLIYYEYRGERGFISTKQPSYYLTISNDGESAIATPAHFKEGSYTVKMLATEVYAVTEEGKISYYTRSFPVRYHAGDITLQRIETRASGTVEPQKEERNIIESNYVINNLIY